MELVQTQQTKSQKFLCELNTMQEVEKKANVDEEGKNTRNTHNNLFLLQLLHYLQVLVVKMRKLDFHFEKDLTGLCVENGCNGGNKMITWRPSQSRQEVMGNGY